LMKKRFYSFPMILSFAQQILPRNFYIP